VVYVGVPPLGKFAVPKRTSELSDPGVAPSLNTGPVELPELYALLVSTTLASPVTETIWIVPLVNVPVPVKLAVITPAVPVATAE
jgi:hypothetical protein